MGIGVDKEVVAYDTVGAGIGGEGVVLQSCRIKNEGVVNGGRLMEMRPAVGQEILADGVVELGVLVPMDTKREMDDRVAAMDIGIGHPDSVSRNNGIVIMAVEHIGQAVLYDGLHYGMMGGVVDGEMHGDRTVASYGIPAYDNMVVVARCTIVAAVPVVAVAVLDVGIARGGIDDMDMHGDVAVNAMVANEGSLQGVVAGEGLTIPDEGQTVVADNAIDGVKDVTIDHERIVDNTVATITVGEDYRLVGSVGSEDAVVVGIGQLILDNKFCNLGMGVGIDMKQIGDNAIGSVASE